MEKEKKGYYPSKKGWGISIFILLIVLFVFALGRALFSAGSGKEAMGILSDCFFAVGILYTGFSGLSWIASKGFFDSFTYLFRNFSLPLLLPWTTPKKYGSYLDYREEKDENGRKWFPHLLVLGGICLFLSILFLSIYMLL